VTRWFLSVEHTKPGDLRHADVATLTYMTATYMTASGSEHPRHSSDLEASTGALHGGEMVAVVQPEFGDVDGLITTRRPMPHAHSDDEVLIAVTHAGVNFGDISALGNGDNHIRISRDLPYLPGSEVVGHRTDTGERVIALCGIGGHAEYVVASKDQVFTIPDAIDGPTALAVFVTGVTAWFLVHRCGRVGTGDHVLVQAAGGAVGTIAVQLAAAVGATVVGTASTAERRAEVRRMGAHAVIDSRAVDVIAEVRAAGPRGGYDVVLDCTGAKTFSSSIDLLAPFGRAILFGTPSGQPAPVPPAKLIPGSRSIGGFWLMDAFASPEDVQRVLDDLCERILEGSLRPLVGRRFPLDRAREAYEAVAQRLSVGKVVLMSSGEEEPCED
jgi:NADPH2:quinone reductase